MPKPCQSDFWFLFLPSLGGDGLACGGSYFIFFGGLYGFGFVLEPVSGFLGDKGSNVGLHPWDPCVVSLLNDFETYWASVEGRCISLRQLRQTEEYEGVWTTNKPLASPVFSLG
jgi:hypothetical protein